MASHGSGAFKGLGLSQQVAYAVRMDGHALLAKLMHKRTGEALPALSDGRNSIAIRYRPDRRGTVKHRSGWRRKTRRGLIPSF